jgi:ubiquinone/menaquinone biosynthesis C-methylase UbiE
VRPERFARLATELVVRRPFVWRFLRRRMRRTFDRLAPHWDARRRPGSFAALDAALALVTPPPRRVLDLGTGTGSAALAIAERWADAEVVGVDLSERMVGEARRKTPPALADRVSFASADGASLPYGDGSFDLVTLVNMLPFFDELARVTAPGGLVIFVFTRGAETPIYVPPDRLRRELAARGFRDFREAAAGEGTALLAKRPSKE